MRISSCGAAVAAFCVAATLSAGSVARADSQKDKNNWRNAAIAGGAATLYGLVNHQHTTTLLGAAGTAYSLKRYEDARHKQSQENDRRRYYERLAAVRRARAERAAHMHRVAGAHPHPHPDRDYERVHHDNGHHYGWNNPHNPHHDSDGDRDHDNH